jgi:hypothetical protein
LKQPEIALVDSDTTAPEPVDIQETAIQKDSAARSLPANEAAVVWWEISSVIASILIGEWIVLAFAPQNKILLVFPVFLCVGLILFSIRFRGESWSDLGLRLDNFWPSVWLLVVPMVIVAALILAVGWQFGSIRFDRHNMFAWLAGLVVWAVVQQFILQCYINRRVQLVLGRGLRTTIVVAVIFAALHLPNPWLMVATFVGGLIWAAVFQFEPNLPALALSHAVMSMLLAMSLPNWVLNNLRIGYRYFG